MIDAPGLIISATAQVHMTIYRVTIHYATTGHDTPPSTWFWNQTGSLAHTDDFFF